MEIQRLHDWDLSPKEAIALQKKLAPQLDGDSPIDLKSINTVAGVDVSVKHGTTCACVVVLSYPDLELIETVCARQPMSYPYIPGLLTFREGPALEAVFRKMQNEPDVFIFDGMGQMHPRRMGIAAHLGLWLGRPTMGCGKRHFIGEYQQPGNEKGCLSTVTYQGQRVGVVLRTRPNVKPDLRVGRAPRGHRKLGATSALLYTELSAAAANSASASRGIGGMCIARRFFSLAAEIPAVKSSFGNTGLG